MNMIGQYVLCPSCIMSGASVTGDAHINNSCISSNSLSLIGFLIFYALCNCRFFFYRKKKCCSESNKRFHLVSPERLKEFSNISWFISAYINWVYLHIILNGKVVQIYVQISRAQLKNHEFLFSSEQEYLDQKENRRVHLCATHSSS